MAKSFSAFEKTFYFEHIYVCQGQGGRSFGSVEVVLRERSGSLRKEGSQCGEFKFCRKIHSFKNTFRELSMKGSMLSHGSSGSGAA